MSAAVASRGPEREENLSVWGASLELRVKVAGNGPPLVYFHGAGGCYWDRYLDALAQHWTVYAPVMPGMSEGDPWAIHKVDTWSDLLLIYEEALRALDVTGAAVVGQSLGGMVALDLAAHFPGLFARIIALAPAGLWRESLGGGIVDLCRDAPGSLGQWLFADPQCPDAQAVLGLPADPDAMARQVAANTWALGVAGKFLWPFAEQGLERRAHRIGVPVQLIWGREDRLMPAGYAAEFERLLADCRILMLPGCGHLPQLERLSESLACSRAFLAGQDA